MQAAKDLGDLLMEEKLISSSDLERARKQQRERGGRLAAHLLLLGAVSEDNLVAFFSRKMGVSTVSDERLDEVMPNAELKRAIPSQVAIDGVLLPLELGDRRRLSLAVFDPTDAPLLEAARSSVGARTLSTYVGRRGAILAAISRVYGLEGLSAASQPATATATTSTSVAGTSNPSTSGKSVSSHGRPPIGAVPAAPISPVKEGSGKVELDPDLVREIQAAVAEAASSPDTEPVTMPRPLLHSPQNPSGVSRAEVRVPLDVVHRHASEAARSRTPPWSPGSTAIPTPTPVIEEVDEDSETPPPTLRRRELDAAVSSMDAAETAPTPLVRWLGRGRGGYAPGQGLTPPGGTESEDTEPTQVHATRRMHRSALETDDEVEIEPDSEGVGGAKAASEGQGHAAKDSGPRAGSPGAAPSAEEAGDDDWTPIADMLRSADQRYVQSLEQAVRSLVNLAENRLTRGREASTIARIARIAAREMGFALRATAEIGLVAQLYGLDRSMRRAGHDPADYAELFGGAAGIPDGVAAMLRALIGRAEQVAIGETPSPAKDIPVGAQVVLGAAWLVDLEPDGIASLSKDALGAHLEATGILAEVVEALVRSTDQDRGGGEDTKVWGKKES